MKNQFISSQDFFGYNLNFKLNNRGKQKTFIGGLASILIKIMFAVYVFILSFKMFLQDYDDYVSLNVNTDYQELGEINMENIGA